MSTPLPFDYVVVRAVPRVEREEFINVGVILFCRPRRFLAARIELDRGRLAALAPGADVSRLERQLALIPRICQGEGPIGRLSQAERFHWLSTPRSTVVQVSTVHAGLCADPAQMLEAVLGWMVRLG